MLFDPFLVPFDAAERIGIVFLAELFRFVPDYWLASDLEERMHAVLSDVEPDAPAFGAGERLRMPARVNILDGAVAADDRLAFVVLADMERDFPVLIAVAIAGLNTFGHRFCLLVDRHWLHEGLASHGVINDHEQFTLDPEVFLG